MNCNKAAFLVLMFRLSSLSLTPLTIRWQQLTVNQARQKPIGVCELPQQVFPPFFIAMVPDN